MTATSPRTTSRPGARRADAVAVQHVHELGVRTALLSGDNGSAARRIAERAIGRILIQ